MVDPYINLIAGPRSVSQSVYYSGYDINQNSFKLPNISTGSSLETGRGVLDPINSLELKKFLAIYASGKCPTCLYEHTNIGIGYTYVSVLNYD